MKAWHYVVKASCRSLFFERKVENRRGARRREATGPDEMPWLQSFAFVKLLVRVIAQDFFFGEKHKKIGVRRQDSAFQEPLLRLARVDSGAMGGCALARTTAHHIPHVHSYDSYVSIDKYIHVSLCIYE